MANKRFNSQIRQKFAVGGAVKKITKMAARTKAAKKAKKIIDQKISDFRKSFGPAREKFMEAAGFGKEYKKLKNTEITRGNWMDLSSRKRALDSKARKKMKVEDRPMGEYKILREKFGLKGDARPTTSRTFRGKKVTGKTSEERAEKISKMLKKDK